MSSPPPSSIPPTEGSPVLNVTTLSSSSLCSCDARNNSINNSGLVSTSELLQDYTHSLHPFDESPPQECTLGSNHHTCESSNTRVDHHAFVTGGPSQAPTRHQSAGMIDTNIARDMAQSLNIPHDTARRSSWAPGGSHDGAGLEIPNNEPYTRTRSGSFSGGLSAVGNRLRRASVASISSMIANEIRFAFRRPSRTSTLNTEIVMTRADAAAHAPKAIDGWDRRRGPENPEKEAGLISRITLWWMNGLFKKGRTEQFVLKDFWEVLPEHRASNAGPRLESLWKKEMEKRNKEIQHTGEQSPNGSKKIEPSLFTALAKLLSHELMAGLVFLEMADACQLGSPFVLKQVLIYVQNKELTEHPSVSTGIGYCFAMFFLIILQNLGYQTWGLYMAKASVKVRAALIDMVFKKAARLSARSQAIYNDAAITNLVQNQVTRIDGAMQNLLYLISVPIYTVFIIGFLIHFLGLPGLWGAMVLIGILAAQFGCSAYQGRFRKKVTVSTVQRNSAISEMVKGIKVVKFYAWEPNFMVSLRNIRTAELHNVNILNIFRAFVSTITSSLPNFASVVSFVLYADEHEGFAAETIFPVLAYFTVARTRLLVLPTAYATSTDAWSALKDLQKFFDAEEEKDPTKPLANGTLAIVVEDADFFTWSGTEEIKKRSKVGMMKRFSSRTMSTIRSQSKNNKTIKNNNNDEHFADGQVSSKSSVLSFSRRRSSATVVSNESPAAVAPLPRARTPPSIVVHAEVMNITGNNHNEQDLLDASDITEEKSQSGIMTVTGSNGLALDDSEPLQDPSQPLARVDSSGAEKFFLAENVTFQIPMGALVAVVGKAGSGKTGLLRAIIGTLPLSRGSLYRSASLSYAPQIPWIDRKSARSNIVFGRYYKKEWYDEVVSICCLKDDFKQFSHEDLTEMGENGSNLSGGQRARLSLARAIYADADILVLDNPLAAVDNAVATKLWTNIMKYRQRENRTVIIATHHLHNLADASMVICVDNCQIREMGSYHDLLNREGEFCRLVRNSGSLSGKDGDIEVDDRKIYDASRRKVSVTTLTESPPVGAPSNSLSGKVPQRTEVQANATQDDEGDDKSISTSTPKGNSLHSPNSDYEYSTNPSSPLNNQPQQSSTAGTAVSASTVSGSQAGDLLAMTSGQLTTVSSELGKSNHAPTTSSSPHLPDENAAADASPPVKSQTSAESQAQGAVKWTVYKQYFQAGGYFAWAMVFVMFILQQTANVFLNIWLAWWSDRRFDNGDPWYINIFVGIAFAQLFLVMGALLVLVIGALKTAKVLFELATDNVLRAPMAWFDTNPSGRISNRMSKDMDTIDTILFTTISELLFTFCQLTASAALVMVYIPYMIVFIFPATGIYLYVASNYRKSSRQVKRIDAVSRSQIGSYLKESLTGMTTLKVYGQLENATKNFQFEIDDSNKANYVFLYGAKWVALRANIIGALMVLAAFLFVVCSKDGMIDLASAGLVLSYLTRIAGDLNQGLQRLATMENNMNSVERITEYAHDLPQDPPAVLPNELGPDWPATGKIHFENVTMSYRDGLPSVLKRLELNLGGGQKIGIVGRTGAGKSSLIQALFRLTPLSDGRVLIDDTDTTRLGTRDLRTRIGIIPQEPILFQGNIRQNLDPMAKYDDDQLWKALEASSMKTFVQGMVGELDGKVEQEGSNFSAGQMQQLCLARALLQKCRILVLDEATASLDAETDKIIQDAVSKNFTNSTILAIAHRLDTIIDYDLVVVMDAGAVAELGSPSELLQNQQSKFYGLAAESGPANLVHLIRKAAEADQSRQEAGRDYEQQQGPQIWEDGN